MRVLCCLDGTNVGQVSKATEILSADQPLTLGIIYVIDTGPRKDIEHTRERFFRPTGPPGPREHEMRQVEHAAAEDILNEGLRYLPNAETLQRQGRPEREIVNIAAEWQAEHAAAEDILNEGLRYLPNAETLQRQGRPEREIVNIAAEWQADLVILCPRAEYGGKPTIGPKSVGHVARFVVDHAPCPVLLVRALARGEFPIAR
jgi:nucleotide-binding universal stress UspA family protein